MLPVMVRIPSRVAVRPPLLVLPVPFHFNREVQHVNKLARTVPRIAERMRLPAAFRKLDNDVPLIIV
jgi:hypothetical protein